MLATDVGGEIYKRPQGDVGDGFGHFRHQHYRDATNQILSPTSRNRRQHLRHNHSTST